MSRKSRAKSAVAGPAQSLLFSFGKDAPTPGQFVARETGVTPAGRPPSAGYRFRGQCTAEGARDGPGVERLPDKSVFRGTYADGRPRHGVLTLPSGTTYEGDFADGVYHGQGCLRLATGAVFRGTFRHGKLHGHGTLSHPALGRF